MSQAASWEHEVALEVNIRHSPPTSHRRPIRLVKIPAFRRRIEAEQYGEQIARLRELLAK